MKEDPMKHSTLLLSMFVCSLIASQTPAANVTFKLYLGQYAQGPGTFKLTATASQGDNFGISRYGVELVDNTNVSRGILTVNHNSLRASSIQNANGEGPAGFTLLRTADLLATADDRDEYTPTGTQDLVTPTPHLIRGFGLEPGSIATNLIQPAIGTVAEGDNWGNAGSPNLISPPTPGEFEIARGTSAGGVRFFSFPTAATFAGVFSEPTGIATEAATVERILIVPEPAAMATSCLGLVGFIAAARLARSTKNQ
jgi:hypothetical protein